MNYYKIEFSRAIFLMSKNLFDFKHYSIRLVNDSLIFFIVNNDKCDIISYDLSSRYDCFNLDFNEEVKIMRDFINNHLRANK